MPLNAIRLELARDPDHPQGSSNYGYEFLAPLDELGHIDLALWRENRSKCRVWRFWAGEDDEYGHLVHTRSGSWKFHYDIAGDPEEDEAGFRFNDHSFREGEYVSLREPDGELHTFRVVSVRPAATSRLAIAPT